MEQSVPVEANYHTTCLGISHLVQNLWAYYLLRRSLLLICSMYEMNLLCPLIYYLIWVLISFLFKLK